MQIKLNILLNQFVFVLFFAFTSHIPLKILLFHCYNGILFGWYIQLYRCAYQIIKGLDKHIA